VAATEAVQLVVYTQPVHPPQVLCLLLRKWMGLWTMP
jgi:hypothetical protein